MTRRRATAHEPHPDSPFAQSPDDLDQACEATEAVDTAETPDTPDTPETPDMDDTGEPPASAPEDPSTKTPAEMAIVLGQALVQQARDAADVEATERAYAGVPTSTSAAPRVPRTGHLPFGDTRFNAEAAVRTIGDVAIEIEQLKAEWDHQKSLAADAKKAYDERVESLLKIIDRLRTEQIRAVQQPTLREVEALETAPAARCPWEHAHPGQRCPICVDREQRRTDAPGTDSPEHPQHAEHVTAAAERQAAELARLQEALQARRVYLAPDELEALSDADLQPLVAWAQSPGVIPPPLMLRACQAGEVDIDSALVQTCTRCGTGLWLREHHGAMGITPYPARVFVGLACQGTALDGEGQPVGVAEAPVETADAATAAEPARKPAKRGMRAKTKKHDPEAERAEQVRAGQAATTPGRGRRRAKA